MLEVVSTKKHWIFKAPLHAVLYLQRTEVFYRDVDPRVWTYLSHSKTVVRVCGYIPKLVCRIGGVNCLPPRPANCGASLLTSNVYWLGPTGPPVGMYGACGGEGGIPGRTTPGGACPAGGAPGLICGPVGAPGFGPVGVGSCACGAVTWFAICIEVFGSPPENIAGALCVSGALISPVRS